MPRIIIALDCSSFRNALDLARTIRSGTDWVKVGLELFSRCGPDIVTRLKEMGFKVFLDLKFFDIPNTVSRAVLSSVDMGADMLTLHSMGGREMVRAAVDARNRASSASGKTLLLGVTLLTSMTREDLWWSRQDDPRELVLNLASKSRAWGLDGCVCSGLEASDIRTVTDRNFCLVTPGIRTIPASDDQKRVVTPEQAKQAGANYLVIGRPVTDSPDPEQALKAIKQRLA